MSELPGLLLIDDDQVITESLAFVLKQTFSVHAATSREEARRFLQTMPVLPNLALVDHGKAFHGIMWVWR
ncbi:MAG: hypothetical protein AAF512_08635 [Pseudomonadota bacterium]